MFAAHVYAAIQFKTSCTFLL